MRGAEVLLLLLSSWAAVAQPTYSNPVLPGDYPDPSVIRVGREYWATATTSHWAPIFPLLRSSDLTSWQTTGAVFPKRPEWAETNFWAPEISEYKKKFFVYYTAKKKDGGPLCVAVASASKPGGPYTDHGPLVCQEDGSIDAMPTVDENGKRYLIWKEDGNSRRQPTPLWAQPLSEDGSRLEGEPKELFHNDAPWEGGVVEGPFVLRRGDWFYLFYSGAGCCGVKCNYALGVARSRKLLGPWEKYSKNPILAANRDWKCPGHGSLVQDSKNRTWFLYHAYHPEQSIFVGRQGLLDQVEWTADEWPVIRGGSGPSPAAPQPPRWFADEFNGSTYSPEFQWPVTQDTQARVDGKGWLQLTPGAPGIATAILAKPSTSLDYTVNTRIDLSRTAPESWAGLAAWGNARNCIGIAATAGKIVLWSRRDGQEEILEAAEIRSKILELKLIALNGKNFAFSYRSPEGSWKSLAPPQERQDLPPWDLAVRVAITAGGTSPAMFDYFRLENRLPVKEQ